MPLRAGVEGVTLDILYYCRCLDISILVFLMLSTVTSSLYAAYVSRSFR